MEWKEGGKAVWELRGGVRVEAFSADLTLQDTAVLVNSTSRRLLHSAGVARALAHAAGPTFQEESTAWHGRHGSLDVGEVAVTGAGRLKASYVVHTVSPHFEEDAAGDETFAEQRLRVVYAACIQKTIQLACSSITFPGLGTGLLGVPAKMSAEAGVGVVLELAETGDLGPLTLIRFVDLCHSTVEAFARQMYHCRSQLPHSTWTLETGPTATSVVTRSMHKATRDKALSSSTSVTGNSVAEASGSTAEMTSSEGNASCPVCMDEMGTGATEDPVRTLHKCGHRFHTSCIQETFKQMQPQCPICKVWYGIPSGNQPLGSVMRVATRKGHLPGFSAQSYIEISYSIPGGIQGPEHPRPGVAFHGTSRVGYLPDNADGQRVLALFRLAFDHRLMFTVGDSVTTGAKNVVTWNNIHHKTSTNSGPHAFGYPDPTYLNRVEEELAAAGITRDMITK